MRVSNPAGEKEKGAPEPRRPGFAEVVRLGSPINDIDAPPRRRYSYTTLNFQYSYIHA
jgi:hypothetical protein